VQPTSQLRKKKLAFGQVFMSVAMDANKFEKSRQKPLLRWGLAVLGLGLVVWQFFTFLDIVEVHTAHAQKISQSASWAGQPVGVMPQVQPEAGAGLVPLDHAQIPNTGMMRANLP